MMRVKIAASELFGHACLSPRLGTARSNTPPSWHWPISHCQLCIGRIPWVRSRWRRSRTLRRLAALLRGLFHQTTNRGAFLAPR